MSVEHKCDHEGYGQGCLANEQRIVQIEAQLKTIYERKDGRNLEREIDVLQAKVSELEAKLEKLLKALRLIS